MSSKPGSTSSYPRITKRSIQLALGGLWLLDGALQLQPQMFTRSFATQVIAPAAQGQPSVVGGPMTLGIHIILLQPALFNVLFALIQLALGVLILWRPTVKVGLLASVAWSLVVWYGGEGLGGLLTGNASLLMGAPGAAILYAILALAVLPAHQDNQHPGTQRPAAWLPLVWAGLWVGGAIAQLLPGQNRTSGLATMISGMGDGAPSWLAATDTHIGNALQGQGWWVIGVLVAAPALIGLLALVPGRMRLVAVSAGVILSLGFWVVGQNLGGYYTGLATDPNAAPLFILMGVALSGCLPLTLKPLWQNTTRGLSELLV